MKPKAAAVALGVVSFAIALALSIGSNATAQDTTCSFGPGAIGQLGDTIHCHTWSPARDASARAIEGLTAELGALRAAREEEERQESARDRLELARELAVLDRQEFERQLDDFINMNILAEEFRRVGLYADSLGLYRHYIQETAANRRSIDSVIFNFVMGVAHYRMAGFYEYGLGVLKNLGEAYRLFGESAKYNSPDGYYALGVFHEAGFSVPQNFCEAEKHYRNAINIGNAHPHQSVDNGVERARLRLAIVGLGGRCSPTNYKLVYELLLPLVPDNAEAAYIIGNMHERGQYVSQNTSEALRLHLLAADAGSAPAQNSLGVRYANGRGVAQDHAVAVSWFRKAAEQGNAPAQYNLGMRYANGRGVPQDHTAAVSWYRRAADQGLVPAQNRLKILCGEHPGLTGCPSP